MDSLTPSRRHGTDLLSRPPCGSRMDERSWSALIVDPSEQLEALADLLARGLLSPQEYSHQKAKVLDL
jgi:Short C-terminal domain